MFSTRRDFLKALAAGLMTPSALLQPSALACKQAANAEVKITGWTGDDFRIGHQFRDGAKPSFPDKPERLVDFAIVGGGLSGLTAAWRLRDENFLLLEQYSELGGQARGSERNGLAFSYGPAYVGTVDGISGQLFDELGIKPEKVGDQINRFYWNNAWTNGLSAKDSNSLYRHFKQLMEETGTSRRLLPAEPTPENIGASPELTKLDGTPFQSMLSSYPPEFVALMQSISKSATCGNVSQVSALAGLYAVEDLASPNYVFEGGNPAITRAIAGKLRAASADRLVDGAFVWDVRLNENSAEIKYTSADGTGHTVQARHVIVATPPMVAWRQISNLDDKMRASLMPFKYGSYLVANCVLSKPLFHGAYDNWVAQPFTFTDVIIAETPYKLSRQYNNSMGSVLTIYHPWEPGTSGRSLLLQGDKDAFAKSISEQLGSIVEHLDSSLQEIVLTRWGHAMVVPTPNFFGRLTKIAANRQGPYSLAYSGVSGFPWAESAIRGGWTSAAEAKKSAGRISMLVP